MCHGLPAQRHSNVLSPGGHFDVLREALLQLANPHIHVVILERYGDYIKQLLR